MSQKELSRRDIIKLAMFSAGTLGLRNLPKGLNLKDLCPIGPEEELPRKNGIEILKTVEYEGIVTASNLPIIFVPLRNDYFYDQKRDIELWKVKNINLGVNKILYLQKDGGQVFRVATLHHTTGNHSLPIAIIDEGSIDNLQGEYRLHTKYGRLSGKEDVSAEFSLIGDYYPNKTHNLLEAAAQLLRFQIENGPFVQNQTYSTMEMFNIRGNYSYKMGKENYQGYSLRGDGVCGMATTLAHTLSQAKVRFDEQRSHSHWTQYWIGPLDPDISIENDTTISSFEGVNHDFKWTPLFDKPHYLSIEALLAVNGLPSNNPTGDPNSRVFFQLMLTKKKPDLIHELTLIEKLQEDYTEFNRGLETGVLIHESSLVEKIPRGADCFEENIIKATYVEESVRGFEKEILKNDSLKDISELKKLTNEYIEKYPHTVFKTTRTIGVGTYIRESKWYETLTQNRKEAIDGALSYLDMNTYRYFTHKYEYEAVQCVGWVMLLSSLGYENSPINIQSHSAVFARNLIPEQLRTQWWLKEKTVGKYKYIVPENLSGINIGDLFVTYSLPYESTAGHVGAIVGKKKSGDETILLISDSNRKCDGAPRIFRVDKANAHAIFGRPPKRWVVIRKKYE
jgi:hypothetical protein